MHDVPLVSRSRPIVGVKLPTCAAVSAGRPCSVPSFLGGADEEAHACASLPRPFYRWRPSFSSGTLDFHDGNRSVPSFCLSFCPVFHSLGLTLDHFLIVFGRFHSWRKSLAASTTDSRHVDAQLGPKLHLLGWRVRQLLTYDFHPKSLPLECGRSVSYTCPSVCRLLTSG